MLSNKAAEAYQRHSTIKQKEDGKRFRQNEVNSCPGDTILDLGCGTGELSTYLAELVGEKGRVMGVDPDTDRIKVAQESHKGITNLSFFEGSTCNFPGMGSETYDWIYSSAVLHWVTDKKEAFKKMFSSLKPTGKITVRYCDRLPTVYDRVYRELNPENFDHLVNMFHCETRPVIEEMCVDAGFNIRKSYDIHARGRVFENGDSLRAFFWATTHGMFDPQLVTEERLASFCARYSSEEAGQIKLCPGENDFFCALIAMKPAIATDDQLNNN